MYARKSPEAPKGCFAATLAAFAVLLLVSGLQMASQCRSALVSCAASHTCGDLASTLSRAAFVLVTVVTLTLAVPCLLGSAWADSGRDDQVPSTTC